VKTGFCAHEFKKGPSFKVKFYLLEIGQRRYQKVKFLNKYFQKCKCNRIFVVKSWKKVKIMKDFGGKNINNIKDYPYVVAIAPHWELHNCVTAPYVLF
jgi:lysophospholipid acyltransferase (LPLAT)-like uncharacterized protein